jgi:hypothetical protein
LGHTHGHWSLRRKSSDNKGAMGSASSTINRLEKENRALENELANIRYQLKMKDLEIEASLKMV